MSSPRLTAPGVRFPLVGAVSDTVLGWGACLALAAWVLWAPLASIGGIPGHLGWLGVVGAACVGLAFGAYTSGTRAIFVLGAAVMGAGLVVYVMPDVLTHVRFVSRQGAVRLCVVSALVVLASIAIARRRQVGVRPAELLVVGVVTTFLMNDWTVLHSHLMRDLRLYLVAGDSFLHGQQPYITEVVRSFSGDETQLPFLYPPFTLPFFAILSQLPQGLVIMGWLSLSVAGSVAALRWLGVRWAWVPLLLLWPPFFEGMAVGNVAVLTFVLFVAGPRLTWALPLMAFFKLQSAVPSLWLVRERRWSSLAIGLALAGGTVLATLPIVGIATWSDWLHGLLLFQQSQAQLHFLYGFALPRYIPYSAFLILSVVAVAAAAISGRGLAGLARLGIASVVASPSLYRHGFLVTLPGLLGNSELLLWLTLGLSGSVIGWWLMIAVAAVGTLFFGPPGARAAHTVHPLGASGTPWSASPRGTLTAPGDGRSALASAEAAAGGGGTGQPPAGSTASR